MNRTVNSIFVKVVIKKTSQPVKNHLFDYKREVVGLWIISDSGMVGAGISTQ
ncbi:hypothetical protein FD41_GL000885 [Lentilactobacillus farraginis DSM 18382 = JCM 14108]|uniref:Uncharacterized protein n=1 Tax=Lentilactobacillus farraginis DSM 18382 = JCM 14108 TaxID=1423743 RepID=A0A0R1VG84_9LACO|nr:hypothetical protein FD41_GL000885 [Lentilactobacillus farraginis DSM 18382 = JCM 14108]